MIIDFSKIIKIYLKDPVFIEVFNIVKSNSQGKIWLTGGFLYKNIVNYLYGDKKTYNQDIDFLVSNRNQTLLFVDGWNIEKNSYGIDNYVRENNKMSFTEIGLSERGLRSKINTIDDFIRGTPLDIQSIAYDIEDDKFVGQKGIEAILNKTISINNFEEAIYYAERKGKSLEEIVKEKAKELSFEIVL